ncbi:tail fiber assembly protein [Pseudomonas glycinae]|uniref:tail fiber assembly protein n=1 Tax=Pseudomonas TaxID=286 RepID=UPI0007E43001|nr:MULTISPECIES: tail fiber assembly protein [Pseudomonas]
MFNYLFDHVGCLSGPVEFVETPGLGVQLPSNSVQLPFELPSAGSGRVWALVNNIPREVSDHRGVVYRTDSGAKQMWGEPGELPDYLTAELWPGEGYIWNGQAWKLDEAAHLSAIKSVLVDKRDTLLRDAILRIAPLQYAEDIGDASHEEQLQLLEWKLYSVELNRIEKQAGFPEQITWPSVPGTRTAD